MCGGLFDYNYLHYQQTQPTCHPHKWIMQLFEVNYINFPVLVVQAVVSVCVIIYLSNIYLLLSFSYFCRKLVFKKEKSIALGKILKNVDLD